MGGYKVIPGHANYAISKGGRVARRKDGKVMKQTIRNDYLFVSIDGKQLPTHRLVAATYLTTETLTPEIEIHHINGDKHDCRASNLAVCPTRAAHNYEHYIIREYFKTHVAHTKKFRAYRDMMLNRFDAQEENENN